MSKNGAKQMLRLAVCLALLAVAGCGHWEARVESNTSWSGSFNGTTVDGRGSQRIDLGNDGPVCCVVQKYTRQGYLRVKIKATGFLRRDGEDKRTDAEFGVVSVCTD